jgi:hypothetical protein
MHQAVPRRPVFHLAFALQTVSTNSLHLVVHESQFVQSIFRRIEPVGVRLVEDSCVSTHGFPKLARDQGLPPPCDLLQIES